MALARRGLATRGIRSYTPSVTLHTEADSSHTDGRPRRGKKKSSSDDAPHALVLGAGFGGLAAAVRLLVRGFRVTVVDRLSQAGGRARVFRDGGHVFDAGPTVITAPFLFEELWTLAGRTMADHVTLVPVTPFYRIRFDDGHVFDYSGDASAMRAEVARISPGDVAGYERFVAASQRIFEVGFERLAHIPFGSVTQMLRVVPSMLRLESYRTVYGLVSKYVASEKLRQVLSFHPLLLGGNPYSTTSIYTLIAYLERRWGVHFALGGTGAIVEGLVDLIRDLGGTIRLDAEVEELLVVDTAGPRRGRVTGARLRTGQDIAADLVVSNADSAYTYRKLIPPRYRTTWTDQKLDGARYSMGLFVWYFGTKRQYPEVAHHTILLGPRYRGLLEDIFERKILARDFSLYLHRPTATDPTLAPSGCDTFYVLSPVPHLEGAVDWAVETEPYRQRIANYLEASILPGLADHLAVSRTLTPKNFEEDYLSIRGAGFGLEPILSQSAYFRPHNESEELTHLYLVGAGTHPGGGMPGVLSSARVLDSVVPDVAYFERARR